MEMTRSFPGFFNKGRGKRRFPPPCVVPAKKPKPLEVCFYLLPKYTEKSPNEQEKVIHMQAGLGCRTAHLDESTTHEELCDALKVLFPKLVPVTGGWLLYKTSATMQQCPVCTEMFPVDFIEVHASSCGESAGNAVMRESTVSDEQQAAMPGPSRPHEAVDDNWLTISDPEKVIFQCAENFRRMHEMDSPLLLSMDMRKSPAEQDMALISFYKRPNVEWARPLTCNLEGDTAIGEGVIRFFLSICMEKLKSGFCINFAHSSMTRLFEGEPDHLVPSSSHFLVESDMFLMAGRMLGHSFVHGGVRLSGLSPAVIHVLLGGSPETATVTLEDCPDLDIRATIRLV